MNITRPIYLRQVIAVLLAAWTFPTLAQSISGPAQAIDGDTLSLTGMHVRLFGIDAVELDQTCEREGRSWACGRDAQDRLAQLVAGQDRKSVG